MVTHSIIKLKITNPAIGSEEESYVIEILSPRIYQDDVNFSVPKRLIYEINEEDELILELLPTNVYFPIAKYQVNIYTFGKRTPIDRQVWVVPLQQDLPYSAIVKDGVIPVPEKYYQMVNTSFEAEYTVNNNLFIINPIPIEGTVINLSYKPYLTIFDVIEKDSPGNPSPVRYFTYV